MNVFKLYKRLKRHNYIVFLYLQYDRKYLENDKQKKLNWNWLN